MSSILRECDTPSVAWKNGQGSTRQLAIFPADAGNDTFLWRISVATVDSAAPFSRFPGVDRQIALLYGDGFTMTLDRRQRHALVTPFEPFAFPGEAMVEVELAGGATQDFNLMLRREKAIGRIDIWRGDSEHTTGHDMALLYCATGQCTTPDGVLTAGDSWLSPVEGARLALSHDGIVLAVTTIVTG
jgi:environmental stress-induced protein Ves